MSSKQDKITKMLEMQKKFIAKEQSEGVEQEALYDGDEDGLGSYQARYTELANQLVEMAHAEKGSSR